MNGNSHYMELAQKELKDSEKLLEWYQAEIKVCTNEHRFGRLCKEQIMVLCNHNRLVWQLRQREEVPPKFIRLQRRADPTDLPELEQFLATKAERAAIMRDFTDNKIYFLGLDNHVIAMAEYQELTRHMKAGASPASFIQGETRTFKTGYVKRTKSYTENTVFIPYYHAYAAAMRF